MTDTVNSGKDITFGTDILPNGNGIYDLGNSSYKWNGNFNTINGVSVGSSPKFTDTTYTLSSLGAAAASHTHTSSQISDISTSLIQKSDELLTTNPFAPSTMKGPYISKIDNAFYALDKRFTVSGVLTKTDGTSSIITSGFSSLFDGNYEGGYQIKNGSSLTLTLHFGENGGTTYFPGYPYGHILVNFYYVAGPANISARAYCNYASQGTGWHDLTITDKKSSKGAQTYSIRNDYYEISEFEITITGDTSNTYGYTQITEIEMHLDRPAADKTPFLSKYGAETLYYNLTAPTFIGNLTGNVTGNVSGSAGSVAWANVTDHPTSATNSKTGISIAAHGTGTVTGVQSSTTTASKASGANSTVPTLGTAFSIPNVTAAGSGSYTQGSFSGGSGSFSATVSSNILSFSHTHTAATHGADSHTHTAPTLGTKFTVPNVTDVGTASTWSFTDVTVPIKNTSASTFVTGTSHTITDNGHTHTLG